MARQKSSLKSFKYLNNLYFYEIKNVKYLRLRIDKNNNLKLSIPKNISFSFVYEFLDKNQAWIKNNLVKIKQNDDFYLLGKKYLVIFDDNLVKTRIFKNLIYAKNQEKLEEFIYKMAKNVLSFLTKKWLKITKLSINHLSIKKMNSRWGSCNNKKAYINLNSKLIHFDTKAIEYVILHELAHLIYPNHKKEFYDYIYSFMSDFRQRSLCLKF